MLFTIPDIDTSTSSSAVLAGWLNQRAAIHWTMPSHDLPTIAPIQILAAERVLTPQEQRMLWAALIDSSTLAYEL